MSRSTERHTGKKDFPVEIEKFLHFCSMLGRETWKGQLLHFPDCLITEQELGKTKLCQ